MSRKLVKCFVMALVVLLAFASVRAQDSGNLTFAFWNSNPNSQKGWEAIVAQFNKEYPNIQVKLLPIQGSNWGTYLDGVATVIAGGEKPDLMWVATEGVQLLVNELKLATPLDSYIEKDKAELQPFLDDVLPAMLDAFKVDGKQYMLPYSWNNMVIYYNTARFEEAGLEAPKADWTRDQFLETAKKLTVDSNNDGTPERYGFVWDPGAVFFVMPWIYANGGNIVSDDFCKPTVTDPKVEEALQFMHDMIYVDKVAPAPTDFGTMYNLFQNGDVAMFGAGRWPVQSFIPAGFTDFDIQLWPGNPDRVTEFGIDGFPILTTSQNPDLAWQLVKFMTRTEVQSLLLGSEDSPLTNIPARRSVADGMKDFLPKNSAIFYGSLEGPSKLIPAPPRYSQMESTFLRYTGLIFADEMSVTDAMAAAQTELESIVTCN